MLLPRAALSLALSIGLLPLAGCGKREKSAAAGVRTQTLHMNGQAEPRDFDPQTTTHPADIDVIRGIFEGLTELDAADCHPVQGVAATWMVSPDGLAWTFKLRPEAKWSNGDPVTAKDFVFAYQRILSPALGAEYREQFSCLKNADEFAAGTIKDFAQVGARAADDHTLVLELTHPVPYLPTLVSQVCWFPLHRGTIEKYGRLDQRATAWTRPGNLVGNGAFNLAEWQPSQHVRLAKSTTYWDRANVKLNEVYFHPVENTAVGEAALRAGQIHITPAPLDKIAAYRADPAKAPLLHEAALLSTQFVRFNARIAPLNDARVRRALSLAIDREQIAKRVVYCDLPAYSFTPPNCAGYTADATVKGDVAEARKLLAEAGFPEGKGFPKLEMLFYMQRGLEKPVVEALQQMWRTALGVDIALVQQEMKTVLSARRTGEFQMIMSNWTGDYLDPTTFLDILRKDASNNATGWSNPDYDRLLDEANRLTDSSARFAQLKRAEALMLKEAPIAPLFFVPHRMLYGPEVKGYYVNLLDLHTLKFMSLEAKP